MLVLNSVKYRITSQLSVETGFETATLFFNETKNNFSAFYVTPKYTLPIIKSKFHIIIGLLIVSSPNEEYKSHKSRSIHSSI